MKAFLSWSGEKSRRIAAAFSDWLPCVVQALDPWVSLKDIDRGSIWFNEIFEQLKDTHFAIVLVTRENQDRPWLLFEAGALSKGLTENRVCTVLVDLEIRDIDAGSPLRQLNHTVLDRAGVFQLVKTINKRLDGGGLQERRLEQTFGAMWPELEGDIQQILTSDPAPATPERKDADVLNDILENVLRISRKVSSPPTRGSQKFIDQDHARALVKRLTKMGHDRGDILEATERLIPERWLNSELDKYFGPESEDGQEAVVEP